ncbi:MAG: hypothetical protein JWM93_37 [Frankiales bacterium]|nr:hypothetical protein [Frankiales bacterium]
MHTPQFTPQVTRLLTITVVFTGTSLLLGRIEALLLAAPAAGALLWQLGRRPGAVRVALRLSTWRCVEGDQVTVEVTVTSDRPVDHVAITVPLDPRLELVEGKASAVVSVGRTRPAVVTLVVRPRRWGVHTVGPVRAVASHAAQLVAETVTASHAERLQVVPSDEAYRSRTALPLPRPLVGAHVSRRPGDGTEYAETRPYASGDPLRRVDWKATARRGTLMVADRFPERTTELVLFLDTFVDAGPPGATTLDIAVRAAIAIAHHHLPAMDRVGVVGFGGVVRWLPAGAGRRHFPRLVDHVIGTEELRTYESRDVESLPPRLLPPNALVIALSPLIDDRAVDALATLSRRGHGVVIVDTFPVGYLPEVDGPLADVAVEIWRMEREASIRALGDAGCPVVPWSSGGGLDAILAAVQQRLMRAPKVRR